ncbi:NAD(P)/FAD-dependent oxidoreductase [Anaerosporobacter faecicola]|uniref:NAD(P)/FAD-dependent oxidoreductase n=1 Tax=Anaerosporobacter faecicola TaxID=2718714 RepID=UPI00143B31A8|nr:NAD(P)/FAD-dependent oxidoreductase [Anaerosporobacter faecicola]
MIKINQLKLGIEHSKEALEEKIAKTLKVSRKQILYYEISKQSIDARKKNDIMYTYTVFVTLEELNEKKIVERCKNNNVTIGKKTIYHTVKDGTEELKERPVVVGTGPAGIFCALKLAEDGFRPIVIERGDDVDQRVEVVNHFWKTNELNTESNVQFGEGGAGTFSDGKLNTLVKDVTGRNTEVLRLFVEYGAPEEILYLNKPHIGTDRLREVVKAMRNRIIALGGEVRFRTKLTDLRYENAKLNAIEVNDSEWIPCEVLVLAIGHSARDTFTMLYEKKLEITKKPFAIGVRMEHPQELISKSQYGESYSKLPAADYKVTHQTSNGRGVYSFCMCPGGFVVNASSEKERLVVNGMSNYDRGEKNANSAIIVTVNPEDFDGDSPLAGMEFQRKLEHLAYMEGKGSVPVQLFCDFEANRPTTELGSMTPNLKGQYTLANVRNCLPSFVSESIIEGVHAFDQKIHGFAKPDALMLGVETRTSSPIKMIRNEELESNIAGLYPCGEGAGYAGGITSAAMDGIKVYEMIVHKYKPFL